MKQSPGPGFNYTKDYFPKDLVQSLKNNKFGTAERDKIPKDTNLGPGIYNPENSLINMKKGFSILGRLPNKPNTSIIENPGPGTYDPKEILSQSTCQFMSTRRQVIPESLAYPGPGEYNIDMKQPIKQHSTFGKSLRKAFNAGQNTPGVGKYELRLKISGPTIPIIGKKDQMLLPDTIQFPGPGKYLDTTTTSQNSKNYCFGLKLEQQIKKSSSYSSPGPGQYSINRELDGSSYSFGQKHFDISCKNTLPGPGSYEIASTIAAIPNYLNSSKISFLNLTKSIGDESLELQNQILGN